MNSDTKEGSMKSVTSGANNKSEKSVSADKIAKKSEVSYNNSDVRQEGLSNEKEMPLQKNESSSATENFDINENDVNLEDIDPNIKERYSSNSSILNKVLSIFKSKSQSSKMSNLNLSKDNKVSSINTASPDYDFEKEAPQKLTFIQRFFPTQSLTSIFILGIFALISSILASFIPLNGKKQAIINRLQQFGVEAKINGGVYFNVFTMSYSISDLEFNFNYSNQNTVQNSRSEDNSYDIYFKSSGAQFNIFTKSLVILDGWIEAKTDGDPNKIYDVINSNPISSHFSSISIPNLVLSFGTNVSLNQNEKAFDKNIKIDVQSDANSASKNSISRDNIITIPIENFLISNNSKGRNFSANITLEGQNLFISSSVKNNSYVMEFKAPFGTGLLDIAIPSDKKTSKEKVGKYSINITNGNQLSTVLGIAKSNRYFNFISNLTFKIRRVE